MIINNFLETKYLEVANGTKAWWKVYISLMGDNIWQAWTCVLLPPIWTNEKALEWRPFDQFLTAHGLEFSAIYGGEGRSFPTLCHLLKFFLSKKF